MAYQVLARKSRPQDFSSVVGQSSVVTALRNALAEERVAQAYLFAGIRGVGKTSVARVFAKALNCERGPGTDPCNDCTTCTEITKGSDLDVIEVDAATYSKVEQVRELTESLQYGPARDRYKVVVIDEIHRLSRQAFDALLKIVEEPPERVVFIFATTEIDAVPATVLSRCQEFHFRRVAFGELASHLRRLSDSESIEVTDTSLRLVARAAEGSVRDAVALLDQLATFGAGTIDETEAARLIGGLDADFHEGLTAAIVGGDGRSVCAAVARLEEEGWDPRTAYTQLLAYLRDALHLALGAEPEEIDLPAEQAAALAKIARESGSENLLRVLHLLLAGEMTVRRSESGALAAEVAWLRAAELPKLTRIEDFLSGVAPTGSATGGSTGNRGTGPGGGASGARKGREATPGKAARKATSPRRQPRRASGTTDPEPTTETAPVIPTQPEPEPRSGPAPEQASGPVPEPEPEPAPESAAVPEVPMPDEPPTTAGPPERAVEPASQAAAPGPTNGGGGDTAQLLEEVGRRRQFLAAHLAEAESLTLSDGRLEIAVPADDTWLRDSLRRSVNREALEESIAAVWGDGVSWTLRSTGRRSAPEPGASSSAVPEDIMNDPEVQTVLELFGGTVETEGSTQEDDEA